MLADPCFGTDYASARGLFLDAAKRAGAALETLRHPSATGPDGGPLFIDIAAVGPDDADAALVSISGTHGAEGFCGSGAQVAAFEAGLAGEVPRGVRWLVIHAINPFGFAWLRRVTDGNVDLNRNHVDFTAPLPVNEGFDELKEALCPREWTDASLAAAQAVLDAYATRHGASALQRATSGGQYRHDDAIFYGGNAPTWSRRMLQDILLRHVSATKRVGVIDFHTGLGPYGYGEPIVTNPPGTIGLERARSWYGDAVTSPTLGSSTSTEVLGDNLDGIAKLLGAHGIEVTGMALEFGTLAMRDVLDAVRGDNWLHLYGDLSSPKGREMKRRMRDAFFCDASDWKGMIAEQGIERQRQALAGLAA